jgi:hypothetical protein
MQSLLTGDIAAALSFVQRLGIDLLLVTLLIRGTYYRHHRRTDLFLTFFSFNVVIFLITNLLTTVEISLSAAFGLFAVFSMLRYRTEGISTPDMTYLFMVIALGLITAASGGEWLVLMPMGLTMIVLTELLESGVLARRELMREVHYDNARLLAQPDHKELIADLRVRTGLEVHRVDVQEIDFLRDAARLRVFFYAKSGYAR